ncbi:MAG: hypothetical protein CSB15_00210 [Clostridiales bacterium]|nr:MAG: hypothetical protein CSB15_00210 [Clostridiales bacterium]
MRKIDIKGLRKIQLEILDIIHEFCEKNSITYYLSYGTLIGAVRHKGFIPWDDDVDISMPREDYDKFINSFNDYNKKYKLLAMENDENYPYTFAKVVDADTFLVERDNPSYPIGVYIDLFPIDGTDKKGKIILKQRVWSTLYLLKNVKLSSKMQVHKTLGLFLSKILLFIFPKKFIRNRIDNNIYNYDYSSSNYVAGFSIGESYDKPIFKSCFEKKLLTKFEDREYYIPVGYDEWLKSIYGEYMNLPPVDKQKPHHSFDAYYKD